MKKALVLSAIALLTMTLGACQQKEEAQVPENDPPAILVLDNQDEEVDEDGDNVTELINPLTGEETDDENLPKQRPWLVVMNTLNTVNIPQAGISQADILVEFVVEGGITRMLAVFQDLPNVQGEIGPVRSARHSMIEVTQAFDGIFAHAGESFMARDAINNWGIDAFDGNGGAPGFYRDPNRMAFGTEHSMMTTAEGLLQNAEGIRTEHESDWNLGWTFSKEPVAEDAADALIVDVWHSGGKNTLFEYDAEVGRYVITMHGAPYTDSDNNERVQVTNVLVLRTNITQVAGHPLMDVPLSDREGTGTLFTGGKEVEFTWSRGNGTAPLVLKNLDGTPLVLGVGPSFINIVDNDADVRVTRPSESE